MANGSIVPGGKPAKKKSMFQKLGKDVGNIGKGIGKAFTAKKGGKGKMGMKKPGGMKPVTMKGFGSGS
jgi:hypothetical protein